MFTRRKFIAATGLTGVAAAGSWAVTSNATATPISAEVPETCEVLLENEGDRNLTAYITGLEFGTDRPIFVQADSTVYYLEDTSETETPLPEDCSIPVNGSTTVTIPRMHGSRIYFISDDELEFFVNPGPALVEPSFDNEEDTNFSKTWSFCEFTFNDVQLFINISYVDLVTNLPIGLTLEGHETNTVESLPDGALENIASDMAEQADADGRPWDDLILTGDDGELLRVISPQNLPEDAFGDYWDGYVDEVWDRYTDTDLVVDIQGGRGEFAGRAEGDELVFEDGSRFEKPNALDIFSCDSGPFTNNPDDSDEKKGILARLAAAFNRSTLRDIELQPNGATAEDYYQTEVTNHYARIVHDNSPIGYAFPYDDVNPDDHPDQSGAAWDGNPQLLTVRAR